MKKYPLHLLQPMKKKMLRYSLDLAFSDYYYFWNSKAFFMRAFIEKQCQKNWLLILILLFDIVIYICQFFHSGYVSSMKSSSTSSMKVLDTMFLILLFTFIWCPNWICFSNKVFQQLQSKSFIKINEPILWCMKKPNSP